MLPYGRLLNALPLLPILGPTKLNQVTLKELPEGAPRRSSPKELPEGVSQDTLLVKKNG